MGRSFGVGQPIAFACSVDRRTRDWHTGRSVGEHFTRRTGRARYIGDGHASLRSMDFRHEYVCSCGHKGWSRHRDVMLRPLVDGATEPVLERPGR